MPGIAYLKFDIQLVDMAGPIQWFGRGTSMVKTEEKRSAEDLKLIIYSSASMYPLALEYRKRNFDE